MSAALAGASVVAFLALFACSGIVPAARRAIAVSRRAGGVMRDPGLDDPAKEAAVQRAGLELLGLFGSILVRSALTVAAALLPVWLGAAAGIAPVSDTLGLLERWEVIVAVSVATAAAWLLGARVWRG